MTATNLVERPTFTTHLECAKTGTTVAADTLHNLSPEGWPLLVRYDLDGAGNAVSREEIDARRADLWRYRELLPVRRTDSIVSLGETETPLIEAHGLMRDLEAGPILFKDEGRLPTGSFKARGLALAVSMAQELGVARMAMPTNGNAGAALAAYCSRASIESVVFCPDDTPATMIREIALQGARLYRVNGYITDCGAIVGRGARAGRWFDTSTLKEPYRIEGKKTMGLELVQQLGWSVPDAIFYPTGGGTGLIGMWKAFAELEALGWIGSARPRMIAVQASGCAPIVKAFEEGADHAAPWENATTIATGIRVPAAIGDFLILRAVRASGGFAIAVDDAAIVAARREVVMREGLLLCPEGAATYAAYRAALEHGRVGRSDRVVLFNCGNGLKYPMPRAGTSLADKADIDVDAL